MRRTPSAAPCAVGCAMSRSEPQAWSPEAEHDSQGARLFAAGVAAPGARAQPQAVSARLAAILPRGCQPRVEADAFCAFPPAGSRGAAFLGTLSGAPVGAATCWQLADWLLALHRDHPDSPVVLVLDADGHAATVTDEQLLLSAYLVHLSLTLAWLRSCRSPHRAVDPGAGFGCLLCDVRCARRRRIRPALGADRDPSCRRRQADREGDRRTRQPVRRRCSRPVSPTDCWTSDCVTMPISPRSRP